MNKEERGRFLASREWAIMREAVRARSDNTCERCYDRPMQACHHLTYARYGGNERLEDLQAVCDDCHEFLSGKRDDDPAETECARQIPPDVCVLWHWLPQEIFWQWIVEHFWDMEDEWHDVLGILGRKLSKFSPINNQPHELVLVDGAGI